jgi:F0F1-type ATP synthase epsilon subunit
MADFPTTIVTPQGKIFEDKIESLSAPGAEGYLGILAHHAPLVAMLATGILKLSSPREPPSNFGPSVPGSLK